MSENTIETVELFLAIPCTQNVVIVLPSTVDNAQLGAMIDKFDIKVIFTDRKDKISIEKAGILVFDCIETADEEAILKPCSSETPAAIFLTSGTTGQLKGALHSHGSVLYAAHNSPSHYYAQYGTLEGCFDGRMILSLPLSHVMGMVSCVLFSLYARSVVYICKDFKKSLFIIPSFKPDRLLLVPGMVEVFLSLAEANKDYLSGIKHIICGAADTIGAYLDKVLQLGIKVYIGYGLSETAGVLTSNFDYGKMPKSVGFVHNDIQVSLVNDELWIKSPSLMLKYYNDPDLTEKLFKMVGLRLEIWPK